MRQALSFIQGGGEKEGGREQEGEMEGGAEGGIKCLLEHALLL